MFYTGKECWPEQAPSDGIIVTAIAQHLPPPLHAVPTLRFNHVFKVVIDFAMICIKSLRPGAVLN
jgi:hypothetical protein